MSSHGGITLPYFPYLGQTNVRLIHVNTEHAPYKGKSQWSWWIVGRIPVLEVIKYQESNTNKQQYSLEVNGCQKGVDPHREAEFSSQQC